MVPGGRRGGDGKNNGNTVYCIALLQYVVHKLLELLHTTIHTVYAHVLLASFPCSLGTRPMYYNSL